VAAPPSFTLHTYGTDTTKTWVFEPSVKPRLVVLFVHGLGDQMKHLVTGIATAAPHLPEGVPVAALGYSRGGRLVADYASIADVTGVVPSRIFSVFPAGTMDRPLDLAPLDGRTKVLIVAGDQDRTVANIGANQLVTQLAVAGFPYKDVKFEVVRSHGFFVADHLSVLDDSPAARKAFWARADRFFAPLVK
jgi:dienelactone hydrolase